MPAMPVWGASHDDRAIWGLVALVRIQWSSRKLVGEQAAARAEAVGSVASLGAAEAAAVARDAP